MSPAILGWEPTHQGGDTVEIPSNSSQTFDSFASPVGATRDSSSVPSPASSPDESKSPRIPRPRNAFMVFRCEYAKSHSRGALGLARAKRRVGVPSPGESLSKRAADAWRSLSDEAKIPYLIRADNEKEEHSLMYPDYRFKPQRTAPRKSRSRRPVSTVRNGPKSHRRTATPKPKSSPRSSPVLSPADNPPLTPPLSSTPPLPEDSVGRAAVRAVHRRSLSAPHDSNFYSQAPIWSSATTPKSELRRSRSNTGGWMNGIANYSAFDLSTTLPTYDTIAALSTDELSQGYMPSNYVVPPSPGLSYPAFNMSPSSVIASSLADWDGKASAASSSCPHSSSTSASYSSLPQPSPYDSPFLAESAPDPAYTSDLWNQSLDQTYALDNSQSSFDESALQEFGLGIAHHVAWHCWNESLENLGIQDNQLFEGFCS